MGTSSDAAQAIRLVKGSLQGPVSAILSGAVPELSGIPKPKIYDHVLDNLNVLAKSFKVLRTDRKRFEDVLVTKQGKYVEDDTTPLTCGRTVRQIVGMVLCSATKRHFRRVATGPAPLPHLSSVDQAEDLYMIIRDYLLHDWQVNLVPTYAEMTPAIARQIGADLAEIQDSAQLQAMIQQLTGGQVIPIDFKVPQSFTLQLSEDGQEVLLDPFDDILAQPDVQAHLGKVRARTVLGLTGGPMACLLVHGLNLTPEQFVVIMTNAYDVMGRSVFLRIFANPGEPDLITMLNRYGRSRKLTPESTLTQCVTFIHEFMDQAMHSKAS